MNQITISTQPLGMVGRLDANLAFSEGMDAGSIGRSLESNPYGGRCSHMSRAWVNGHEASQAI